MHGVHEATAAGPFELSGGALCLDFANTWGNHADPGSDRLLSYDHLVAFARQTGLLDERTAAAISRAAVDSPERADAALSIARELRQALYRIFSARARGRDLPPSDVERVNGLLGEALSHRRLRPREDGLEWGWSEVDPDDLQFPIFPVVESAAALLTSRDLGRIRECDAGDCNWLFLDRSRSRSRRWCSMTSCGNRAKARRHYRRRKSKAE